MPLEDGVLVVESVADGCVAFVDDEVVTGAQKLREARFTRVVAEKYDASAAAPERNRLGT